ncbi:MAG TPA: hypothetical protein VGN26_03315, partial [Armatimonadota bacterium]
MRSEALFCLLACLCSPLVLASGKAASAPLVSFNFKQAATVGEWKPAHDVAPLVSTSEGMEIRITGGDPYVIGPARDLPAGTNLWLKARLKSDQGGTAQVFYFQTDATEEHSVRLNVRPGAWEELRVPLPPQGPGTRLRLDPPGDRGACVVESLMLEPRDMLKEPAWPKPDPVVLLTGSLVVGAGPISIHASRRGVGQFVVAVRDRWVATGHPRPLIGYILAGEQRWLDLGEKGTGITTASGNRLRTVITATDQDTGHWKLTQEFIASPKRQTIDVRCTVTVDQDRNVTFLPMLLLLPGSRSFGTSKGQALLAGQEYLEDEPSSSEADIIGPGSHRQVPDSLRLTFPLMAIQAEDRYLGLLWKQEPYFSALFDSPDRLLKSNAHLMGILYPGSDGSNRLEGSPLPYDPSLLKGKQALTLSATLVGGVGKSVVPAVQRYVELVGLPPLPATPLGKPQQYARWSSQSWLSSKIGAGGLYRHAYWPGSSFNPQPTADVAYFLEWLAPRLDAALADQLRGAAAEALSRVPDDSLNVASISHVRYPVTSLIFGHVAECLDQALKAGNDLLSRFQPDGTVLYDKPAEGNDLARTHWARHANGLTGQVVASLLESAVVTGDPDLRAKALAALKRLDIYRNSVPRGAQTWEVPLHTPDILASAHLVKAYTYGYELTGDPDMLGQARYWAWTGVPFVYLVNPTAQPVGPYATIAVYGATQWVAPNWMGLPVQWCGLVYSDALYRLARLDPKGPWRQLAEGITLSGIQQSWPSDDADLQGLLPDSFNLRPQTRNPVAINPGT